MGVGSSCCLALHQHEGLIGRAYSAQPIVEVASNRILSLRNPAAAWNLLYRLAESKGYRIMARRYSRSASKDVKRAMHKRKRGTLKSGRSGKTVRSRKQAIAIGLSEARKKGKKVPKKRKRG
jgi:hypothetical protein